MGLISFIKNLFKQKEDDLWLEPNSNKKSSIPIAKCDDHIIEVDTLTGEIIIKGNIKETYYREYWFLEK